MTLLVIAARLRQVPELLGKRYIQPLRKDNAWPAALTLKRAALSREILHRYREKQQQQQPPSPPPPQDQQPQEPVLRGVGG